MTKRERQRQLVKMLAVKPWFYTPKTLAAALGVSEITVHKDISELEARGYQWEYNNGYIFLRQTGWDAPGPVKDSTVRQIEILRLINAHKEKGVAFAALAARFCQDEGVSAKTLQRDLKELAAKNLVRQQGELYFISSGQMLHPLELDHNEKSLVLEALALSKALSPLREETKSLEAKLRVWLALPEWERETLIVWGRTPAEDWRRSFYCQRLEEQARTYHKALLLYRRGDGPAYEIKVNPLGILYYWALDNWYLVAQTDEQPQEIKTYLIDRILAVDALAEPFEPVPGFSLEAWYRYAWGVFRSGTPVRVVIRFHNYYTTVQRVREELSCRASCRLHEADGALIMEDEVDGLGEIAVWLRGFGPGAEVIEPRELREMVTEDLRQLAALYGGL